MATSETPVREGQIWEGYPGTSPRRPRRLKVLRVAEPSHVMVSDSYEGGPFATRRPIAPTVLRENYRLVEEASGA